MLHVWSWMHSCWQELCKEQFMYEDYFGDFHIQTHIVFVFFSFPVSVLKLVFCKNLSIPLYGVYLNCRF
ncbi:hypothetical protein Hanom_Chr06g00562351 [Helianthus anomalus]